MGRIWVSGKLEPWGGWMNNRENGWSVGRMDFGRIWAIGRMDHGVNGLTIERTDGWIHHGRLDELRK